MDAKGIQACRVMLIDNGPQAGQWRWVARARALPNSGAAETKEAAMAAAEKRWNEAPLEL